MIDRIHGELIIADYAQGCNPPDTGVVGQFYPALH